MYAPSLHRMFATDQIWYFAELEGSTSLRDGLRHYDYAESRRFYKGDNALFRPLLMAWLAFGNRFFSHHYAWWNVANLALHLGVVWLLHRFLWRLRPSWFAGLFTLGFSIAPGLFELVVWNHLGGYLWAMGLFMISLGALRLIALGQDRGRDRWVYAGAMTVATGFYEVIVPISILFAAYAVWMARRRTSRLAPRMWLVLLLPALVFTTVYLPHRVGREKVFYVHRKDGVENIMAVENSLRAAGRAATAVGRWAGESALPTAVDHEIVPYQRFGKRFTWTKDSTIYLVNFGLVAIVILAAIRATKVDLLRREWPLAALMGACVFAYALVIGFGRSLGDIVGVSYYLYFFTLAGVIAAYAVLDFERAEWSRRIGAALALEGLILLNGLLAFGLSTRVRDANLAADAYFGKIVELVDANKHDPGFTFAPADSPYPASIDPIIFLAEGYPTDPGTTDRAMRLSEIIFHKYYNEANPRFRVGTAP